MALKTRAQNFARDARKSACPERERRERQGGFKDCEDNGFKRTSLGLRIGHEAWQRARADTGQGLIKLKRRAV